MEHRSKEFGNDLKLHCSVLVIKNKYGKLTRRASLGNDSWVYKHLQCLSLAHCHLPKGWSCRERFSFATLSGCLKYCFPMFLVMWCRQRCAFGGGGTVVRGKAVEGQGTLPASMFPGTDWGDRVGTLCNCSALNRQFQKVVASHSLDDLEQQRSNCSLVFQPWPDLLSVRSKSYLAWPPSAPRREIYI